MTATEPQRGRESQRARDEQAPRQRRRASPAARAARSGMRHVAELTGRQAESVVVVERRDEGWRVGVEVVEVHRIPDTADLLAVYEADLDEAGELVSYRRTRRYPRGRGEEA